MASQDFEEFGGEDELTANFAAAATFVQTVASTLNNETLLTLYGFYKQGSEGPCNIPKPSWYDMRAKAKWEVWKKLGDLPPDEAKECYIEMVKKINTNFQTPSKSSKESWVTVSTLKGTADCSEDDKSLIDHIKAGNFEKVTQFLQSYDAGEFKSHINDLDKDGLGLIHWAADRGSVEILSTLMSFGALVNLQDSEGQTPLHYAVSCGHIECTEYLLKMGADASIKDADGLDSYAAASDETVSSLLCNYQNECAT